MQPYHPTWTVSWVRLNVSTTSWLPRRADQKVMCVACFSSLPAEPTALLVLLALPDPDDPPLPLQALSAPVSGRAAIVASTDRRPCRSGMYASRGS